MSVILEKCILIGLIAAAIVTAWAVLTPNHLFVG
mgnify:CR=1 FL=1|jgi:hypothetical protein